MCPPESTKMHSFLSALPKCEHHMHLEGALTPSLLFSLSEKNSIPLPSTPDYASPASLLARYSRFTCLDDFLSYYYIGMSVLRTSSDFEELAWSYFTTAAAQNVRHAEVFFDPQAHVEGGVAVDTVVEGITRARKRAEKELGVSSLLIMCFLRHLPAEDATRTWESAKHLCVEMAVEEEDGEKGQRRTERKIEGVGLCSTEKGINPADFAPLFALAKAAGLRLTAHAGEEGPPQNLRDSFTHLHATRIDHGIRAAEDSDLLDLLAARRTLLTVCPLSNVRLKCVPSVAEVPLQTFLERGVRFSINSDDPAYFGGFVQENYCEVQRAFGWDVSVWEKVCADAIEGSWCGEERKEVIRKELEAVVGKFKEA